MDMTALLGQVSLFVNEAIDWITAFANCITSNSLLLAFTITAFVGLGVGLLRRLISL